MESDNPNSETSESKESLSLVHLTKYFGKHRALLDVNLGFTRGLTLIIGPLGAGKSTMLNIIAGKYRQSFGIVKINGMNILYDEKRAKKYVGYVSENPQLPNDMTSLTLLEFMGVLCKDMEKQQARLKAKKILSQLNLEFLAKKKISKLTTEEQYLVAFLGELLRDTPILLIDEPYRNVVKRIESFINLIVSLSKSKTIIVATSYLPANLEIFSRIILFHSGIAIKEGTARSLGFYDKLFKIKVSEKNSFLSLLIERNIAKYVDSDENFVYAQVEYEKLDAFNNVILEIANHLNAKIEEITSETIPFNKLLENAIKEYQKGVEIKNGNKKQENV